MKATRRIPPVREYPVSASNAPTLVLGHGAGAGQDHPWMRKVAQALADRDIRVVTFDFPYVADGRSVPDRAPVLEAAFASVWIEAAAGRPGPMFAGGKSMGGRIASQVAARGGLVPAPAGLVFFGYPLHPPAKPAQRRDAHLSSAGAPLLFLSGTKDPFGSPEEFSALVDGLNAATLELFVGGDHSIATRKKADAAGALLDRAVSSAAAWIKAVSGGA